jgi:hypothetical protein
MLTTDEILDKLEKMPRGSAKEYLRLECLIAMAVGFADELRENEGLRSPVEVEFDALLGAVAELGRSVRRMVR